MKTKKREIYLYILLVIFVFLYSSESIFSFIARFFFSSIFIVIISRTFLANDGPARLVSSLIGDTMIVCVFGSVAPFLSMLFIAMVAAHGFDEGSALFHGLGRKPGEPTHPAFGVAVLIMFACAFAGGSLIMSAERLSSTLRNQKLRFPPKRLRPFINGLADIAITVAAVLLMVVITSEAVPERAIAAQTALGGTVSPIFLVAGALTMILAAGCSLALWLLIIPVRVLIVCRLLWRLIQRSV